MVGGTSLKVTAWMVHHSQVFAGGAPQEHMRYESPTALTTDDADMVVETCSDEREPGAEAGRGAGAQRGCARRVKVPRD